MTTASEPFDPEDYAEHVSRQVFLRRFFTMSGVFLLGTIGCFVLSLTMRVFIALAVWHVPEWAIGFLVCALLVEVVRLADKAARLIHLLRTIRQARPQGRRSLRARMSRPRWWQARVMDMLGVVCVYVVFAAWHGTTAGLIAEASTVVLLAGAWSLTARFGLRSVALGDFATSTEPRDTPEM